ncbi:MAG: RDD family protein, partial [Roseibium sp.]|uniref:RDD family protein n=1 Tax=Roseibium sp. TaxID=1936156 RepID=UPI002609EB94
MKLRLWKSKKKKERPSPDVLMPPEGVALTLPIAGVGVRLAAQIADVILTTIGAICLIILLNVLDFIDPQSMFAVAVMLFFLIRTPYYVLAELGWNGQTLGKRFLKIKV